ncbi:hypothetical protein [Actinoplanes sp. NPDC049599]|uniref:hypothetical protein n=1 Tax=Actinoplanes sp. NPDC049599 TaxID=3363903 RepID=UPI003789B994
MPMSAEELRDATCIACPAQVLRLGEFDVIDRPGAGSRYDPELGYRVETATDTAVCVHPYRVGLPVGTYCSTGMPVPAATQDPLAPTREALELPQDVVDLEAWIIAVLRAAGPGRITQALGAAEALAAERFGERDVVTAMRRVLTVELARQH